MADNYLEFSEVIAELTPDEAAWLGDQLQPVVVLGGTAYRLAEVPDTLDENDATYRGPRFLLGAENIDIWGDEPEFSYSFLDDCQRGRRSRKLWLYSETYGSVDQVTLLVQKFLRKFRPGDLWSLSYATTCSKPRVGQFGGGVVLVTASRIRWLDAEAIAARALQRHAERMQRRAA